MTMKKLFVPVTAAALALCFAVSASAATVHKTVSAELQASCKAQAAKKFSAIHFIKRRNFANDCLAKHARTEKPKATVASKPAPAATAAKPMPSPRVSRPSNKSGEPRLRRGSRYLTSPHKLAVIAATAVRSTTTRQPGKTHWRLVGFILPKIR